MFKHDTNAHNLATLPEIAHWQEMTHNSKEVGCVATAGGPVTLLLNAPKLAAQPTAANLRGEEEEGEEHALFYSPAGILKHRLTGRWRPRGLCFATLVRARREALILDREPPCTMSTSSSSSSKEGVGPETSSRELGEEGGEERGEGLEDQSQ